MEAILEAMATEATVATEATEAMVVTVKEVALAVMKSQPRVPLKQRLLQPLQPPLPLPQQQLLLLPLPRPLLVETLDATINSFYSLHCNEFNYQ